MNVVCVLFLRVTRGFSKGRRSHARMYPKRFAGSPVWAVVQM
jgi:hypothetical protein